MESLRLEDRPVSEADLRSLFDGFLQSIDFANRIAGKAQQLNHRPDFGICFNQVTFSTTELANPLKSSAIDAVTVGARTIV